MELGAFYAARMGWRCEYRRQVSRTIERERPSECSTAAETTFVNDVLDVERWGDRLVETRTDRDATIRPEHLVELQGETSTLDYGDWGRTIPRHC